MTIDSVLHTYHILFDYLLRRAEADRLIPAISELTGLMLDESVAQLERVPLRSGTSVSGTWRSSQ